MHLAELLQDLLHRLKTGQPLPLPPEDELGLPETAQLLHLQPAEVIRLHQEGVLTSTQPSSPLKFYREEVLAYQAQRQNIQLDPDEETPER